MKDADRPEAGRLEELGACPLCGRRMFKGDSVDRHHWQPKSQGGTAAEYLHRICHRKLHSLFTGRELADRFSNPAQVRQHPEMKKLSRGYAARHRSGFCAIGNRSGVRPAGARANPEAPRVCYTKGSPTGTEAHPLCRSNFSRIFSDHTPTILISGSFDPGADEGQNFVNPEEHQEAGTLRFFSG